MTPAKLLLLGEHTVLHGGEALALPLPRFAAQWTDASPGPDAPFVAWAAYAAAGEGLGEWFDVGAFAGAAPRLSVASTIPQDYGLGSSGALAALVYRRFARPTQATDDLAGLRARLGALESFFHGKSSGLDPLVCYLERPVLVGADATVSTLPGPGLRDFGGRWFLLDARVPKAGREAIARFGESCRDENFRRDYLRPALSLTADLIRMSIADGDDAVAFRQNLRRLSGLQLAHLSWLIPAHIQRVWRELHTDDRAYLKLCGAGGGGYFLGYASEPRDLRGEDLVWV